MLGSMLLRCAISTSFLPSSSDASARQKQAQPNSHKKVQTKFIDWMLMQRPEFCIFASTTSKTSGQKTKKPIKQLALVTPVVWW